jgi:pepF/M3 family oligoendopeptidase
MNEWSLRKLYEGFDDPKFAADFQKLESQITVLNGFQAHFATGKYEVQWLIDYLKADIELNLLADKLSHMASLTASTESTNATAVKTMNKIQTTLIGLTETNTVFRKWVKNFPELNRTISKYPFLREHDFYLNEIVDQASHMLDEQTELLLSKLRQSGSTAGGRLQSLLTSTLSVAYEGREITLSEVRNLASDNDSVVRMNAYFAELKAYEQIEKPIAFALNAIKGEVNTLCEARGYASPLDQALSNSRLSRGTLDAMISVMVDFLPVFRKYLRRKAELLGHQNGLPFYDLFAPIGAMTKTYSIEEANAYILKNFQSFSPRLYQMAAKAFEEHWIDYTPRKGKVGGAFCANMPAIKESRILTNYTGAFGDIITIAHELGHAYHGEAIFGESVLNTDYTMPVAETASIFCETIVIQAALRDASSKAETLGLLESSLQDATQVIVDILSRFYFEQSVFDGRKKTVFDEHELKKMMLDAQEKTYGDGLDSKFRHPYMWVCKGHYYRGGLSYYNFPYAYGLLFAKGLYAQYLKDKEEFVPKYDLLLASTGKMVCEDVAKMAGIDVTGRAFWIDSLKMIEKDIELFLDLTK